MYVYITIHWTAQTYNVHGEETEILYFIRHNADADANLFFRVSMELIAIGYRTHTERVDFLDGCLTVIAVIYKTTPGIRVSLV